MKKILVAFCVLLTVAVMSVGCNKNGPKEVATTWLNAFYHGDYETAKSVSTEDTKTFIASVQQFASIVPDSNKKEMKKIIVTVKNVKEDGDKAVATYTSSENPGKEQTLPLVKTKEGKWLVQFSKNDQMNAMGDDNPGPEPAPGADSTGGGSPVNAQQEPSPDSSMH